MSIDLNVSFIFISATLRYRNVFVSVPVVKEQCRMMSQVTSSPTPLTGNLSVVGVGE